MFQIINDTKSAPSMALVPVKIPVSPLSNQKAHVLANYMKFANHFLIWTTEMETPNFTANCAKSTQFINPYCKSHEISPICADF